MYRRPPPTDRPPTTHLYALGPAVASTVGCCKMGVNNTEIWQIFRSNVCFSCVPIGHMPPGYMKTKPKTK
jgi:hypothetical protein